GAALRGDREPRRLAQGACRGATPRERVRRGSRALRQRGRPPACRGRCQRGGARAGGRGRVRRGVGGEWGPVRGAPPGRRRSAVRSRSRTGGGGGADRVDGLERGGLAWMSCTSSLGA